MTNNTVSDTDRIILEFGPDVVYIWVIFGCCAIVGGLKLLQLIRRNKRWFQGVNANPIQVLFLTMISSNGFLFDSCV
jgi:hypothetical protein